MLWLLKKRINLNWSIWGFAVIFFAAAGWISGRVWSAMPRGAMEQGGPVPVATAAVGTLSTACWIVAGGLVVVALASLGLKALQGMQDMVGIEDVPETNEPYTPSPEDIQEAEEQVASNYPVYGEVAESVGRMALAVREIKGKRQNAILRIQDAIAYSDVLAGLAERAATKAVELDVLAQELRGVAVAVRDGDRDKMAELKGSYPDESIRHLLGVVMIDASHGGRVVETLFTQVGAYSNQSYVIRQIIKQWLDVFDSSRAIIGELEGVARELGAAEYVLQLDANILQATQSLQLSGAAPDTTIAASNVPRSLPGSKWAARGRDRPMIT